MPIVLASPSAKSKFVDINVPAWAWVALLVTVAAMLAFDLVRHKEAHAPTSKEALKESLIWVACGLTFALIIWRAYGTEAFAEYMSGYVLEKSLSVDNVFVWALLFSAMAIPIKYQHRVLFWGIFGALALRAAFIFAGKEFVKRASWVLIVFGVFLIYTGFKILREALEASDDVPDERRTPGLNLVRRFMPVTDTIEGQNFFTKVNGKRAATPLFAALVVVELTDVLFAVDSVPAIFGVANEAFIIFASNAFAILGLRAMYFLLADAKEKFLYLQHALGVILLLVGIKMVLNEWIHVESYVSLPIIVSVLGAGIYASIKHNKNGEVAAAAAAAASKESV